MSLFLHHKADNNSATLAFLIIFKFSIHIFNCRKPPKECGNSYKISRRVKFIRSGSTLQMPGWGRGRGNGYLVFHGTEFQFRKGKFLEMDDDKSCTTISVCTPCH